MLSLLTLNLLFLAQLAITSLKSKIDLLEQGMKVCSKLTTIKTPERRQWRRSGVFIVNFEQISLPVLVFLFLTLSR